MQKRSPQRNLRAFAHFVDKLRFKHVRLELARVREKQGSPQEFESHVSEVQMPPPAAALDLRTAEAVSYTHLTLPTTPYV